MEESDFIQLIKKKRSTILSIIFVVFILTIGLSLLSPLKYGAKSRLLVVQNVSGKDPYVLSRTHEYLGNLFSQVVYSGSFYNLVLESAYDIDKSYFKGNYNEQLKLWSKTVDSQTISDTGIIEINVYHPNIYQARQIALAVNDVLINRNTLYQGIGQGIKINIIDQPLISNYPIKPNLPQNAALALAGGLLLALFYVYLWPEEKYSLHLWKKGRKIEKKLERPERKVPIEYYPVQNQDESSSREVPINQVQREDFRPRGHIGNVFK